MIKMLNDRWHLKCDLHRRHILLKFTPCRCPFAVMDPQEMYSSVKSERQCGVHAINSAVGGQVLLAGDMLGVAAEIANRTQCLRGVLILMLFILLV